MNFKGGALLFKTDVKSVQDIILAILYDTGTISEFIHKNTSGEGVTYIFKITFDNDKFNKYFENIDSTTPSVFIIKLLAHNYTKTTIKLGIPGGKNTPIKQHIGIDESQFKNEINTHKELGSQTNSMPLCPSFLHHERINSGAGEESFTPIGKAFYEVIKRDEAQFNDFERFILFTLSTQDKSIPTPTGYDKLKSKELQLKEYSLYDVIQEIIIMEYVDCKTLFQLYHVNLRNSDEVKRIKYGAKYLYNTKIVIDPIIYEEVFLLLYLATLLALEGYSHGDLHTNNVLVCLKETNSEKETQAKLHINPILIDFGKAEKLQDLKFRVMFVGVKPIPKENNYWNENKKLDKFKEIYYDAQTNQDNIAQFIKDKLTKGEFVYALIVISMCISKTADVKEPSMFMYYFFLNKNIYETFYSMFDTVNVKDVNGEYISKSINYNEKIVTFIELRKNLLKEKMALTTSDTAIKVELDLDGGKYNKHKYQKRTQRKRRITLYKKKSKKSKKSKKIKKKKSKTRSIK